MVNIFEDAYFGKVYKTRNGKKAVYLGEDRCWIEGEKDWRPYHSNGNWLLHCQQEYDIVSEWQEELNEAALCKTALNFVVDFLNKNEICLVPYKNYNEIGDGTWNGNHFDCNDLTEAFEAGFCARGNYCKRNNK